MLLSGTGWTLSFLWPWEKRNNYFFGYNTDIIYMIPILAGSPLVYVCNGNIMRQLFSNEGRINMIKPHELTLKSIIGDSLASSSGDIWRRHRRVLAPAFNPKVHQLVWDESSMLYDEMISAQGWADQKTVIVPNINDVIIKFSLLVIARCAFGLPGAWLDDTEAGGVVQGYNFTEALSTVTESFILKLIFPRKLFMLPFKRLRHIDKCWTNVEATIRAIMSKATAEAEYAVNDQKTEPKASVLKRLMASLHGQAREELSEDEVVADMYTLLFAGHETVACALYATLGYLAIYQDEQEKAFLEIQSELQKGRPLNVSNVDHLQACFFEAIRLRPPPFMLPRDMDQDMFINISYPAPEIIILKKGVRIVCDLIGIFRNPHEYPEPATYRPSRWYGGASADTLLFGSGPRTCIGRNFAHNEAISFLARFLRDWKVHATLQPGETLKQYEDWVMGIGYMHGTAFSVGSVALTLTRRQ
ncbi:cytochrome P450 [Lentinula aciculospora]|uniref:Cytochrome P450 n=1 Tax=Lentinula aciculospora TaxID=153920 RepID=A0A9W9ATM5_9AGAR|nr:cytochrome P450 [Lentinula aciculospora]